MLEASQPEGVVQMKWVTFYTKGTPYKHDSHRLESSMRRLGLKLSAYGVPDLGSWQKNAQYKAEFIRDIIKKRTQPTVWIDADAVVWQTPVMLQRPPIEKPDFMAAWTATNRLTAINSAVMYWGGTDKAREIVDRWVDRVRENPKARHADQTPLDQVIKEVMDEGSAKTYKLPPTYCYIFDKTRRSPWSRDIDSDEIVIEQFQASRWYRHWRAES